MKGVNSSPKFVSLPSLFRDAGPDLGRTASRHRPLVDSNFPPARHDVRVRKGRPSRA